ncbi:MAG: alanine racemase [Candidatus Aminicenantes bacterium]|nr:alanine racemase [Candidatus Aminicenantes bacterium]
MASSLSSFSLLTRIKEPNNVPLNLLQKTPLPASHDPWIELDLENMSWNLSQARKLVKVPVMAVIKANAYGHGLIETGKHLERIGIDYLMVGKLQEALLLRKAGVSARILNFGSFSPAEEEEIILNDISQSVFTESVLSLDQTSLRLGKKTKIHIHMDTGMGRMGIPYHQALPYLEKVSSLKGLAIEGVSTTLTEDDEFDREQLRRFLRVCGEAESKGISLGLRHAASSDGMMDLPSSRLDMVRPGIALYGYYPSEKTQKEDRLQLRPVLQLKSRVVSVKALRPGDSLSYHRRYTAKKPEKIAVIPVGYSDGYPSNAVNKASVLIRGKRFPLIAAITANHCVALMKANTPVSIGDEVTLLGLQGKERITAVALSSWAGVSTYKILIGLNPLLPRVIV